MWEDTINGTPLFDIELYFPEIDYREEVMVIWFGNTDIRFRRQSKEDDKYLYSILQTPYN